MGILIYTCSYSKLELLKTSFNIAVFSSLSDIVYNIPIIYNVSMFNGVLHVLDI